MLISLATWQIHKMLLQFYAAQEIPWFGTKLSQKFEQQKICRRYSFPGSQWDLCLEISLHPSLGGNLYRAEPYAHSCTFHFAFSRAPFLTCADSNAAICWSFSGCLAFSHALMAVLWVLTLAPGPSFRISARTANTYSGHLAFSHALMVGGLTSKRC